MNTKAIGKIFIGIMVGTCIIFSTGLDGKSGANAGGKEVKKAVFDPQKTCDLLLKDEVEAAMKQKVEDSEPQDSFCMFSSSEPTYLSFSITVSAFDPSGGDMKDLKRTLQEYAGKLGHVIKPADDIIGDAFFQLVPSECSKFVHLVKGSHYVVFEARGDGGKELSEEQVKTLVKKAIDRLADIN